MEYSSATYTKHAILYSLKYEYVDGIYSCRNAPSNHKHSIPLQDILYWQNLSHLHHALTKYNLDEFHIINEFKKM